MTTKIFQILTMVGKEDAEVVENALRQMRGMSHVELNIPAKEITVRYDSPTSWHEIERTLSDLGYFLEQDQDPVETDRR